MTLLRPRLFPLVFGACAALFPVPGVCQAPPEALTPPVAKRQPHPVKIHGDTLADDYSWLRNKGTPEVEDYCPRGTLRAARQSPTWPEYCLERSCLQCLR